MCGYPLSPTLFPSLPPPFPPPFPQPRAACSRRATQRHERIADLGLHAQSGDSVEVYGELLTSVRRTGGPKMEQMAERLLEELGCARSQLSAERREVQGLKRSLADVNHAFSDSEETVCILKVIGPYGEGAQQLGRGEGGRGGRSVFVGPDPCAEHRSYRPCLAKILHTKEPLSLH